MKPIFYALLGTILYGIGSVVIEQKLEKFNTTSLVFLFVVPMVPVALIWLWVQKASHQSINFPAGAIFWIVMALGVMYFFADYFYIGAFTAGGNAITITTIVLIAPVIAALVKHFWVGGYPNKYEVSAYVLVFVAMLLIAKGSK